MSDDLVAFLRARLNEDEQAAYSATPGHNKWTAHRWEDVAGASVYDDQWLLVSAQGYDHNEPMSNRPGATGPAYINDDILMAHIARHDPARVLAEVDAKRRIVEAVDHWLDPHPGQPCTNLDEDGEPVPGEPCELHVAATGRLDPYALRLLALPYASHPDYRDEWRP